MKKFRLLVLAGCCILANLLTVSAQENIEEADPLNPAAAPVRIYVGPIGGFNKNFHTGGFATLPGKPGDQVLCPRFSTGDATGYYGGLSGEYFLGDPAKVKSSILARVAYDVRPASFSVSDKAYPALINNGKDVTLAEVNHTAEIKYSMVNIEILYKMLLGNSKIGIMAGPGVGMVMTASAQQYMNLISPLNAQFKEEPGYVYDELRRKITIRDGDVQNKNGIRFGLKLGVCYEISMRKMLVVPVVFYDMGLTKITNDENWRVNAFQAGVDIRFAL